MVAGVKLSAINGGASTAYNPLTDQLVGVRSGTTDLLFFDIESGIGGPFVPYSGATANVNLGSWGLYANEVGTDEFVGVNDGRTYMEYGDTNGSGNVFIGDIGNSYAGYQFQITQEGAVEGFNFIDGIYYLLNVNGNGSTTANIGYNWGGGWDAAFFQQTLPSGPTVTARLANSYFESAGDFQDGTSTVNLAGYYYGVPGGGEYGIWAQGPIYGVDANGNYVLSSAVNPYTSTLQALVAQSNQAGVQAFSAYSDLQNGRTRRTDLAMDNGDGTGYTLSATDGTTTTYLNSTYFGGTQTAVAAQSGDNRYAYLGNNGVSSASFFDSSFNGGMDSVQIFNGTSAFQINDGTQQVGYVWTATDTSGNGNWQSASGGASWEEENPFSATHAYIRPTNPDRLLIDPTNTITDDTTSTVQTYGENSFADIFGGQIHTGGNMATVVIAPPEGVYGLQVTDTDGNSFQAATGGQAVYTTGEVVVNGNGTSVFANIGTYYAYIGGGAASMSGTDNSGHYFDLANGYEAFAGTDSGGNIVSLANGAAGIQATAGSSNYTAGIFYDSSFTYQALLGSGSSAFNAAGFFTDGTTSTTLNDGTTAVSAKWDDYIATLADENQYAAGYFSDGENQVYIGTGSQAITITGNNFIANLADPSNSAAGYFNYLNVYSASIASTTSAAEFTDGENGVEIANGHNAITSYGNIDSSSYSVSGTAGISGTMTTSSLVGKTLTFNNGLITGFA